jgi:hypothetical protein
MVVSTKAIIFTNWHSVDTASAGRLRIVLNKLPSNTEGYSRVLIQTDGKIVAAGITTGTTNANFNTVSNLTLSRYVSQ